MLEKRNLAKFVEIYKLLSELGGREERITVGRE